MNPLVSILIPAYNAEKWILSCIKSVFSQTWPQKEIIVVDDGSRDKTLDILRHLSSPILKVVSQENKGASAARNHALSLSQGAYIQWMDADDILTPDKIAKQMIGIHSKLDSRILLSCSWGHFYYSPKLAKFIPDSLWQDLDPTEWLFKKINENLWMPPMCFLVSRELTEMAGPWNEALSLDDDGEYFCRVLQYSNKVRFSSEAQCFKRRTVGLSSTYFMSPKKLESLSYSLFSHIHILRKMEDSPRVRSACVKLLSRQAIYFFPEHPEVITKMQASVNELGRTLSPIKLSPKYRLLGYILGWRVAIKIQFALPILRFYIEKYWEKLLYKLS